MTRHYIFPAEPRHNNQLTESGGLPNLAAVASNLPLGFGAEQMQTRRCEQSAKFIHVFQNSLLTTMQKFVAGISMSAKIKRSFIMETKINNALECLHQVRSVNNLIQGVCTRISAGELSANEAEGLWVVLEWQNNHLKKAEGAIECVAELHGVAAPVRAA